MFPVSIQRSSHFPVPHTGSQVSEPATYNPNYTLRQDEQRGIQQITGRREIQEGNIREPFKYFSKLLY